VVFRKVYNVQATKVNSLNFPGKLKRSVVRRGTRLYRTKAFKKFFVTVDPSSNLLPEQALDSGAVEAEVVGRKA
jgi:ribosomal protein L23